MSYFRLEKFSFIYALEFRFIPMCNETNAKKDEKNTFTVRMDKNMQHMVAYLQEKKLLNKTAIIRLAVAEMYEREKNYIKNGCE